MRLRWQRAAEQARVAARKRREALQRAAIPVLARYGVQKAVLFGSVKSGSSHPHSDIDLLIMPLEQTLYWDAKHELEEATGYPIDLYTQADDPTLVQKILARGEVIYEA